MSIPGQPTASPVLQLAIRLLGARQAAEAEEAVTKAAKRAKAEAGSGSPALAAAYADMARLHYRTGDYKKAAAEFKHASEGPMPADAAGRRDRLAFMFGFAACLVALDKPADAEKVFRQCAAFARNLHGPATPGYAVALEPLAAHLLRTGQAAEAAQLVDEAYDVLWKHGDPAIASAIPTRAEVFQAVGRQEDAFADLVELPDELAVEAVTKVLGRRTTGDALRIRAVLGNLLKFVDKKFGDGHAAVSDTLAAIAHHEAALGARGDAKLRATAARRAVWSFAVRRAPAGLLENVEVGFEPGGTIHLVPHLARDPSPSEQVNLETVLTQAVDDLYARPAKPTG